MALYFDPVRGQWFPTSSVPVPGTVRLTVTINQNVNNPGDDGGTRNAERTQAVETLARVAQAMVSSQALTGAVRDRNGLSSSGIARSRS